MLIVGSLAALPFGYQEFKQQRALSLAEKSIALQAAGQPALAREAAEAAFNLNPGSAPSLRARSLTAETPTDAFFFSNALLQSGEATPEDLRHYLRTCRTLNFAANIDPAMSALLDADPGEIENWILASEINLQRGQAKLALNCVARALEIDGDHRRAHLLAARIARSSSEEHFRRAGEETLHRLIAENQNDQTALGAQLSLLPGSAAAVAGHPLASSDHQLLAAQCLLDSASSAIAREEIIATAIDAHRSDSLPALIHWLNSNGQPDRALDLADYEHARSSRELFTAWCHAMNRAGRADELVDLFEDPLRHSEIPLPAEALELVLVDAYEASGKPEIAELHWSKVLRTARSGNRRGKWLRLAQWAERRGYNGRAIGLYQLLLDEAPGYAPHWYDRITTLARHSDQLPLLRELSAKLHRTAPENLVYRHNFAYLSALAGEELDIAAAALEEPIARSPETGVARCILALIERRRGNHREAEAQLEQVDPAALDPNSRFLYHTLRGENASPPASLTAYEIAALSALFQLPVDAASPSDLNYRARVTRH